MELISPPFPPVSPVTSSHFTVRPPQLPFIYQPSIISPLSHLSPIYPLPQSCSSPSRIMSRVTPPVTKLTNHTIRSLSSRAGQSRRVSQSSELAADCSRRQLVTNHSKHEVSYLLSYLFYPVVP